MGHLPTLLINYIMVRNFGFFIKVKSIFYRDGRKMRTIRWCYLL